MNKFLSVKTLVFSIVLAISSLSLNAQMSDDFFHVGDEFSGNRDVIYWTAVNGIANNGIGQTETPVGSGLLILTALGSGYAISRRKRNFKKGLTLVLACVMLLGMTQCKKNVETISSLPNAVRITLNVEEGSKANVTPGSEYANVEFEAGDVIYVGYNNACIGTLTYNADDKRFGGDVTAVAQEGDQPLYFYFLGNKTPSITETTKYTVDIIDQTTKYPVISYNRSNEVYTGKGDYTATLFNYCSIMKFTTNDADDLKSQVLCITGMNNTVTVDFNGNGITFGSKDGGLIKMPVSGTKERWAIVLPQDEVAAGGAGSLYSANEYFKGARPAMAEIKRNEYLNTGKELELYDTRFSVSSTKKVLFSSGNLLKTDSENQVGNGKETYEFEDTPFSNNGGSLGYGGSAPTATSARGYFRWSEIISDGSTSESPRLFTVNGIEGWRALTRDEWSYLVVSRKMNSGVSRYYRVRTGASNSKTFGMLLPPDNATKSDLGGISLSSSSVNNNVNVNALIEKGWVFLPGAGGILSSGKWDYTGVSCYYWSTTSFTGSQANYGKTFTSSGVQQYNCDSSQGKNYYLCVRLVHDVD